MIKVKKLYTFMLQGYLPMFLMTFCICLFIVLMQFLWRYIDELVGKGLEVSLIAELFFYAALTMVPMALPLAILLASLMLFGNLGEHFELTALKASGISLLKVMSPLIVLISFISVGAFFFQNNVLPHAQVKMWTLLFSMRQKSPELEIPEGVFYDQITGYNLYVQKKNRDNGKLYDLMIYDLSSGFSNASIILADSGKMSFTEDKKHLFLNLWNGESFENLQEQQVARGNVPYRRESFDNKEIMIPFDASFTRMDDSSMRNQYVGKNISELQHTIDSVNVRLDSIGRGYGAMLLDREYAGVNTYSTRIENGLPVKTRKKFAPVTALVNVDSIFRGKTIRERQRYVSYAIERANQNVGEMEFKSFSTTDDKKTIIRHQIEMHKKFTLSFACLIFFFIGAPLGAIIRKGGLGMPIVVSVFLFIFYYIIDTAGYKMARDGRLAVWEGIWASSAVLLPLGIFLTYKAVNDSDVFKMEVYIDKFKKLLGRSSIRHIELKDVIMDEVVTDVAIARIDEVKTLAVAYLDRYKGLQSYKTYWTEGYNKEQLMDLSAKLESLVEYLGNSEKRLVINKLMDYPVLKSLFLYYPIKNKVLGYFVMALLPVGLLGYLLGTRQQKNLKKEIKSIIKVSDELTALYK